MYCTCAPFLSTVKSRACDETADGEREREREENSINPICIVPRDGQTTDVVRELAVPPVYYYRGLRSESRNLRTEDIGMCGYVKHNTHVYIVSHNKHIRN